MNDQLDFLAIGDMVTDAFIKIDDAEIKTDANGAHPLLCFRYGEKIPFESVEEVRAVGNSANAAVAAARLGLKSALLSHVGKDLNGQGCIDELIKNNVGTHYVFSHEGIPTNYHYALWHGVDRTLLIKHEAYPLIMPNIPVAPKMIYLSSIAAHSEQYHHDIAEFIKKNPDMKVVFQPGTFQMKLGTEVLKDIYANTYAFFCNVEEAELITQIERPATHSAGSGQAEFSAHIKALMQKLHVLGPKLVFVTDSINGAYASDGTTIWFMPVYPHEPYERTGAGDAFSSSVSVALLMGKSITEALRWGPINSMSVVQFVGAQKGLLTKDSLEQYLANAPANYQPTIMM